MFRLSKPEPYKKTPLFPKKPDVTPQNADDEEERQDDNDEEKEEEENKVKDDVDRIPVIFRSFKLSDMFLVKYGYETQILMDMSNRQNPEIKEVFSDITKEMERYGEWNSELYSASSNIIIYIPNDPDSNNSDLYPILMKYEVKGSGQYQGYPYISLPVVMQKLNMNHNYMVRLGSRLPWESFTIQLKNSLGEWEESGSKCMIDIPIQYVSFDEYLNRMYIYVAGLRKEWRSMRMDDTYREK